MKQIHPATVSQYTENNFYSTSDMVSVRESKTVIQLGEQFPLVKLEEAVCSVQCVETTEYILIS